MVVLLLAGCATSDSDLTQANIDRANKVCERQIKTNQALQDPLWFSKWIACAWNRPMVQAVSAALKHLGERGLIDQADARRST